MVFISHKNNPDHVFAEDLAKKLELDGVACWITPESVGSSKDYAAEIPCAIKSCEYFILVLSEYSQTSAHVRKEVDLAIKYHKPIIPLQIGACAITETYEYLLSGIQKKALFQEADYAELLEKCRLGERVVSMNTKNAGQDALRRFTIIKGDFQDNMALFLKDYSEELKHTVFAIGIDRSGRVDMSSSKGILCAVLRYLSEAFSISLEILQNLIDQAKQDQLGYAPDQTFRYKDSVLILIPIKNYDGRSKESHIQLLLIANSQKNASYQFSHDLDDVEGIDSREIIIEIFNKCRILGDCAQNLFVGTMGTNGLSFPYEVITAEILNCYEYAQRIHTRPYSVFYSVRKEDLMRTGLTLDEIMQYISTVTHFFRE